MKAAVLYSADSDPVYDDFEEPAAGPGTQLVDLAAAGIHHLTRSVASGRHYSRAAAFPAIPGLNAVARTAGGQLVFTASARRRTAPWPSASSRPTPCGSRCRPAPRPRPWPRASNPGLASWLPLRARPAEAGPLGTVLVLGVTGMSGFLAAQNARLLGAARVVGAGRSPAGLDRAAAAGTDTVALTGDRAADAQALAGALDGAGAGAGAGLRRGPVAETAFAALGRLGFGQDDRHHVRADRRAGRGRGRRPLRAAAQPEADHLRQRRRLGLRRRDQDPDPRVHRPHRRRLGAGALPDLPAVRHRRRLDRARPSPARAWSSSPASRDPPGRSARGRARPAIAASRSPRCAGER